MEGLHFSAFIIIVIIIILQNQHGKNKMLIFGMQGALWNQIMGFRRTVKQISIITVSLLYHLKNKYLRVSKIVGTGFDGASTFCGKKTGVQSPTFFS